MSKWACEKCGYRTEPEGSIYRCIRCHSDKVRRLPDDAPLMYSSTVVFPDVPISDSAPTPDSDSGSGSGCDSGSCNYGGSD